MPTDWTTRKQQMRERPRPPCEVPGCRNFVRHIGRWCALHDRAISRKGHHSVGRVTVNELRPYRDLAAAFMDQHAEHPGMVAAVDYVERRIAAAVDPVRRGEGTRHLQPRERMEAFLAHARRDAVDPKKIVACGIACEIHAREFPERWPDKSHADVQFAHAVACLAQRRVITGKTAGRDSPTRKPEGFLKEIARQLRDPLIPLYTRAAHHLHQTATRAANPLHGAMSVPFSSSQNANTQPETQTP